MTNGHIYFQISAHLIYWWVTLVTHQLIKWADIWIQLPPVHCYEFCYNFYYIIWLFHHSYIHYIDYVQRLKKMSQIDPSPLDRKPQFLICLSASCGTQLVIWEVFSLLGRVEWCHSPFRLIFHSMISLQFQGSSKAMEKYDDEQKISEIKS